MADKKDKQGFTFMQLLSLSERFGWGRSGRKVIAGKNYCLFNELLTKREAESQVKKLRSIGCLAQATPQDPRDVAGETGKWKVYYWHEDRKED